MPLANKNERLSVALTPLTPPRERFLYAAVLGRTAKNGVTSPRSLSAVTPFLNNYMFFLNRTISFFIRYALIYTQAIANVAAIK